MDYHGHVQLSFEYRRGDALDVRSLYTGEASGIMVDSGMTAVLGSRDGIGEEVVENLDTELERAWRNGKERRQKVG
jgi:hypothetical protein